MYIIYTSPKLIIQNIKLKKKNLMKSCFIDKETKAILYKYLAKNQWRVCSKIHSKVRAEGPFKTCYINPFVY